MGKSEKRELVRRKASYVVHAVENKNGDRQAEEPHTHPGCHSVRMPPLQGHSERIAAMGSIQDQGRLANMLET